MADAPVIFDRKRKSEWIWLPIALIGFAFFAWRAATADTTLGTAARGLVAAGFGVSMVAGLISLFGPPRLVLDAEGYTDRYLLIPNRTLWSEVTNFRVETVMGARVIMADLSEDALARRSAVMRWLYRLSGNRGALDYQSIDAQPEAILAALRDFKARYG